MESSSGEENLSIRVRRALEDLAKIRQLLLSASEQAGMGTASSHGLELDLATELKSVVDALRRLLWAYIETLAAKSGRAPHEILSWYKMELAVDMLRSMRSQAASEPPRASDLEQLINSALAIASQYSPPNRHI